MKCACLHFSFRRQRGSRAVGRRIGSLLTAAGLAFLFLPTLMGAVRSTGPRGAQLYLLGWEGVVPQTSPTSCGPAVIATLLAGSGLAISDLDLVSGYELSARGMSLEQFASVAAEHGFSGRWYRASNRIAVDELPRPAVVHLAAPAGHYAILTRVADDYVHLLDPARGSVLLSPQRFRLEWTGRFFAFGPGGASG